ncbi:hypothetical protein PCO82_08255 [Pectobacteriaceae bacterium CE90]|nr:hypothetical protein PCO82_08255 [Pectobacteriaceae bacterium CE90]
MSAPPALFKKPARHGMRSVFLVTQTSAEKATLMMLDSCIDIWD